MESFNNPFYKLNIQIINANPEMIMLGIEKIVVVFNKNEITNYSQFVEKLNDIYEDYGIVNSIFNKEGFKIIEFNNLHINNIWNYIANNDMIQVSLNYEKEDSISNKNDKVMEKANYKNENNFKDNKNKSRSHFNTKSNIYKDLHNNLSIDNLNKNKTSKIFKKEKYKIQSITSSSLSESSESSSEIEEISKKLKNVNDNNNKKIIQKNLNDENKFNDKCNNNTRNKNLLGKKRKSRKNIYENTNNNNKIMKTNENSNQTNKIDIKNLNYELIPSDKLDDISFLKMNYPKLFLQGTKVKFKIQELLKTGIGVGNYHFGVIDNYNPENNSFLIKDCNSLNEKTVLFMYQCEEEDLMCIELKNFVEIWIETKNGKNYLEKDNELTKHFIRRQVEYYFCDKNYEKDNFLKKNEDENGFIPVDVIMTFNKIQMITKDKKEFIEALKEKENENLGEDKNKSYELNQDFTKIRKIKYY